MHSHAFNMELNRLSHELTSFLIEIWDLFRDDFRECRQPPAASRRIRMRKMASGSVVIPKPGQGVLGPPAHDACAPLHTGLLLFAHIFVPFQIRAG